MQGLQKIPTGNLLEQSICRTTIRWLIHFYLLKQNNRNNLVIFFVVPITTSDYPNLDAISSVAPISCHAHTPLLCFINAAIIKLKVMKMERNRWKQIDEEPFYGISYYRVKRVSKDEIIISNEMIVNNNSPKKPEIKIVSLPKVM